MSERLMWAVFAAMFSFRSDVLAMAYGNVQYCEGSAYVESGAIEKVWVLRERGFGRELCMIEVKKRRRWRWGGRGVECWL